MKGKKSIEEGTKPVHKRNIPSTEINLSVVLAVVVKRWTENPWLILKWLTLETFSAEASSFELLLNDQMIAIATRRQLVQKLKSLEGEMDDALIYIKNYVTDKFDKESAKSYFASFGIEHKKSRYSLPIDRDKRVASLTQMLGALVEHNFQDKEFGTAFWTPIKENYEALLHEIVVLAGQISVQSGNKRVLKQHLVKGLNSIILNIKSNYPDTYKYELRNWGFQKEKY